MTTKRRTKPRRWSGWSARSSRGWILPIPMRRVTPAETMPDSDPSKRNELSSQRDTDSAGEPARAAENGESLMTRLLRALGLKSGTTRDELEEVLEEGRRR